MNTKTSIVFTWTNFFIRFPQYSKETIRNTIREVAKRVGDKEPNKVWEIKAEIWRLYT